MRMCMRWAAVLILPLWLAQAPAASAQEDLLPVATTGSDAATGGGFDFGNSAEPFELSADRGIEWRSNEKTYTARGNALAKQGSASVAADTLVFYTGGDDGASFDRMIATGNVRVISGKSTGYGDKGEYESTQKVLILTGANLRLESDGDVLTARDRIEYWTDQRAVIAYGNAVLVQDDNRITGDKAVLYFADNAAGEEELSQIEATGKVKVINGSQTIFGNSFAHDPDTDIAIMTGNVVIIDGNNEYRGARAEIDNKRKISRLLGGDGARVHTFIKPKSSGGTGQ